MYDIVEPAVGECALGRDNVHDEAGKSGGDEADEGSAFDRGVLGSASLYAHESKNDHSYVYHDGKYLPLAGEECAAKVADGFEGQGEGKTCNNDDKEQDDVGKGNVLFHDLALALCNG